MSLWLPSSFTVLLPKAISSSNSDFPSQTPHHTLVPFDILSKNIGFFNLIAPSQNLLHFLIILKIFLYLIQQRDTWRSGPPDSDCFRPFTALTSTGIITSSLRSGCSNGQKSLAWSSIAYKYTAKYVLGQQFLLQ